MGINADFKYRCKHCKKTFKRKQGYKQTQGIRCIYCHKFIIKPTIAY